jgi:phosphatidylethanolamine/phosphatidyl-N-methylethanolamine N-methyltransferase
MPDLIPFLLAGLSNPLGVAAVAPSSSALANVITAEITPASAPVVELGAGTGAFTRAIIARGVPEERLALIEYGSDFVRLLQRRFPAARILWMDAAQIAAIDLFEGEGAGAIVSGLPLLSMRPKKVVAVLEGAFGHIRQDGAFYQFTYGPRCPVSPLILDRLGLQAEHIGRALANLPPAGIYRIRRRQARRLGVRSEDAPTSPRRPSNFREQKRA